MIGCPVGSIVRGDDDEILILNHCIGCTKCADQCPYGAINMSELGDPIELTAAQRESLPADAAINAVIDRAVVCDMCASLPSGEPACVYACPHEAAFRVDSREFFGSVVPVAETAPARGGGAGS